MSALTPETLAVFKKDAEEVVNGFKVVRNKQAYQLLAAVAEIERLNSAVETLKKRILAAELKNAGATGKQSFSGIFDDLFKGMKKP